MMIAGNCARLVPLGLIALLCLAAGPSSGEDGVLPVLALVGGTVIDGNGGPPLADATVVIREGRIVALGPASSVTIPADAERIDVRGKYLTPGFIDTNVHLTSFVGTGTGTAGWQQRYTAGAIASARKALATGVTTLRDTWGYLPSLLAARDSLRQSATPSPRLLIAGPIMGWGGPTSETAMGPLHAEAFDSAFEANLAQGVGEDLPKLAPDALRARVRSYLDQHVDLIKIGVTFHLNVVMNFSAEALAIVVEEAHRRGLPVDVHADGMNAIRRAVLAGVDVIQHANSSMLEDSAESYDAAVARGVFDRSSAANVVNGALGGSSTDGEARARTPEPRDLIQLLARRHVVCTVNVSPMAQILFEGGCTVALATDYVGGDYDYIGLLITMVHDGFLTPSQVLVAATRNGALASKALEHYGTLEVGKVADILVFSADPLADIDNVRQLERVIVGGRSE